MLRSAATLLRRQTARALATARPLPAATTTTTSSAAAVTAMSASPQLWRSLSFARTSFGILDDARLDTAAAGFAENAAAMEAVIADLNATVARVREGGGTCVRVSLFLLSL
jgi:hypothetical protein